uniref:Uncharacterized protein n=1 Tax=Neogobius melanostomus TaxID=47308 RepID=A0A8C6S611_9GOBI
MGGGQPPQLPTSPPTYESIDDLTDNSSAPSQAVASGPAPPGFDTSALPELPSVPDTLPTSSFGGNTTSSDDIDFDDLTRRLKNSRRRHKWV